MKRKNILLAALSLLLLGFMLGWPDARTGSRILNPNDGREPNTDTDQIYPRWHPPVFVDSSVDGSGTIVLSNIGYLSVAVDSKNVVHVTGANADGVYHYDTTWQNRDGNGFYKDTTNLVGTGDDTYTSYTETDIAIHTNDDLHVVWVESYNDGGNPAITHSDVKYRKFTGGSWGSITVVASTTTDLENYTVPQVAVDSQGTAHVVYLHSYDDGAGDIDYEVLYETSANFTLGGTQIDIDATDSGTLGYPRLSLDDLDYAHFVWEQLTDAGVYNVKYRKDTSTGLTASSLIDSGSNNVSPDVFVEHVASQNDKVHFAWLDTGTGRVRYNLDQGTSEDASGSGTASGPVRIVVDSESKPNILYSKGGGMAYARQMAAGSPGTWGVQEPVESMYSGEFSLMPREIAINPNDGVYVVSDRDGLYTRMIEFNLGAQDGFGMAGMGGNTSVNLPNGNLFASYGLFASQGFGFATAMSLMYNAQEWDWGVISQGWTHNYHWFVTDSRSGIKELTTPVRDRITLFMGDGRSIVFRYVDGTNHDVHIADDEFGYWSKIERLTDTLSSEYKMTTVDGDIFTFRTDGKLREIKDKNGNKITLDYDSTGADTGLLTKVTDTGNRETLITYTADGQMEQITDKAGAKYKFTYNTSTKRFEKIEINQGGTTGETADWQFDYWAADDFTNKERIHLLKKVTTPISSVHDYWYYGDNRLQASEDPDLGSTYKSVDEAGAQSISQHPKQTINYWDPGSFPPPTGEPRAEVTDRRGNITKVEFKQRYSVATKITDAEGNVTERTFDQWRNITRYTDAELNKTDYTYYDYSTPQAGQPPLWMKGNLKEIKKPTANSTFGASASATPFTTYLYEYVNGCVLVDTIKDYNNINTISHAYNTYGNMTTRTHPTVDSATAVETWVYMTDDSGRVAEYKSPENENGTGIKYLYYELTESNGWGLVQHITYPKATNTEQYTYDSMGYTNTVTYPKGGVLDLDFDEMYRLEKRTEPSGDQAAITTYKYYADNTPKSTTGPAAAQVDYKYDALARLVEVKKKATSGVNLISKTLYDPEGNVRFVKEGNTNVTKTSATYYKNGWTLLSTIPGAGADQTTKSEYHKNGLLSISTTGTGANKLIWNYTYNGRGDLRYRDNTSVGNQEQKHENKWNENGTLLYTAQLVDGAIQHGTTYVYDARHRLKEIIEGETFGGTWSGPSWKLTRDKNNNIIQVEDPDHNITGSDFDELDRLIMQWKNTGETPSSSGTRVNLVQNILDPNDGNTKQKNVSQMDGGAMGALLPVAFYEYNTRGELKRATDAFGNQQTFTYDARGNLVLTELPGDPCFVTRTYDLADRLTEVCHDPGSSGEIKWGYQYDVSSNLTQVTDPRGKAYTYEHDDSGRVTRMIYPSVNAVADSESWAYDDRGFLVQHIDADGKVATFTYDPLGRLENEKHVKAGVTLADIDRIYDKANNLTWVHNYVTGDAVTFTKTGSAAPAYDALRRVTEVRYITGGAIWKTIKYTEYDDTGNLTKMTDPEGNTWEYIYDDDNQLDQLKRGTTVLADYGYHSNGLRKSVAYEGGTTQTFQYDLKLRLMGHETVDSSGAVLARFDYEYDARDRKKKTTIAHLGVTVDYTYDCHDRLKHEDWTGNGSPLTCTNETDSLTRGNESADSNVGQVTPGGVSTVADYDASFVYDAAGNRTSKTINATTTTYVYNDRNQLTSETTGGTTTTYQYDKIGNQIERKVGNVTETYSYDYANRLLTYERDNNSTIEEDWLYKYTPIGQRWAKIDYTGAQPDEEWFVYDGQNVLADYERLNGASTYTFVRSYANAIGIDTKVARIDDGTPESTYFYLTDAVGTVHEMVDTSSVVKRRVLTSAFGEDVTGFTPLETVIDKHGLTQRENDTESSLMHFRARSYDPRTGRFIQLDPIKGNIPTEHYIYAFNNPVSFVDPTGLSGTSDAPKLYAGGGGQALLLSARREREAQLANMPFFKQVGGVLKFTGDAILATMDAGSRAKRATGEFLGGVAEQAGNDAMEGIMMMSDGITAAKALMAGQTLEETHFMSATSNAVKTAALNGDRSAGFQMLINSSRFLELMIQSAADDLGQAGNARQAGRAISPLLFAATGLFSPYPKAKPRLRSQQKAAAHSLRSGKDPLRRVLGSADSSHPVEFESIMNELRASGVDIDVRPGSTAYSPARGAPGRLIWDPDASIGALRHEYRHYLDDIAAGRPGIGPQIADRTNYWRLEYRGWMEEVKLARNLRRFDIGHELIDLMRERRLEILK